jgi:transketolase
MCATYDRPPSLRKGLISLLEIKDSDIRLLSLHQCRHAVDHAIHIGGAFSATIPMVSLFYGGIIDIDVEQPTAVGQDMFVLSKGHAIATLASIYADLGYFGMEVLKKSRSITSILNGHPGPLLPGVHLATGPMGQGVGVAQGLAIAGRRAPQFDVYAVTGDGELQEGPVWEAVMYAGFERLENLCVMVDHNGGQLDTVQKLHFPYHDLGRSFASFGWRVMEVDATRLAHVHDALTVFKFGPREGKPTAIICRSTKGYGGFSSFMNSHKVSITEPMLDQEVALQERQRTARVDAFLDEYNGSVRRGYSDVAEALGRRAEDMGLRVVRDGDQAIGVEAEPCPVRVRKAPVRNKRIPYRPEKLPEIEVGQAYAAHKVIEAAMREFAMAEKVVSVDSDLASTSGLQSGVGFVDKSRALNVGVAEANMMLIGEAFAALGYNAWVSTFCPFFDWKILRRIAVEHQERLEVIEDGGWLSEGHGLDYAMLATAADLDTQANGATHMGNDDALILNEAAHIRIINVSCPRQLLAVMQWVMEGNRGLLYIRILRAPAPALYGADFEFEFGKAYRPRDTEAPQATLITSGRCVHEALGAAEQLDAKGIPIEVVDMPSIDDEAIRAAHASGRPVFIAEQNNGYLWSHVRRVLFASGGTLDTTNLYPINLTGRGEPQYVHSGTYAELAAHFGLDADKLAQTIERTLS